MTRSLPRRVFRYAAAPVVSASLVWGTVFGLAAPASADPKPTTPVPADAAQVPAASLPLSGQPVSVVPASSIALLFPDA